MIQLLLAFIAGILTIAAPCILLPLPILLGGSVGQNSKTRPLFLAGGFIVTFAFLGLTFNFLIRSLGLDPNALRTAAVVMLVFFSFFLIWPTPFERLVSHLSGFITKAGSVGRSAGSGNFGGFVMGVVLGIIWTPCAGPILGSILTLIAQEQNLVQAGLLLVSYALGAGVPMLAIAYGGQAITTRMRGLAAYSTRLQQIFGVVMLGLAVSIHFQYDTLLQQKILEKFPILNGGIEQKLICKFTFLQTETSRCEAQQSSLNDSDSSDSNLAAGLQSKLPSMGLAPELVGIENWLNSPPLSLAELRGKVVLVDFWTYSCVNCVRTLPYITKWHQMYADKGLVIIGVHTPEFAFEKETENVQKALKRHGISYPVAQDNDYKTWSAFRNNYWPAKYLIDQSGVLRYVHFGEGEYDKTEEAIRELLEVSVVPVSEAVETTERLYDKVKIPEVYFGTKRLSLLTAAQRASESPTFYELPKDMQVNRFALSGLWSYSDESVKLSSQSGKIKMKFNASQINMVAESKAGSKVKIYIDERYVTTIEVSDSSLYELFTSNDYGEHEVVLEIDGAGFEIFTFTFG